MLNRVYLPVRIVLNHEGKYVIKIDPDLSQEYLKEVAGGEVEVYATINLLRENDVKTNPQLRYFFGVVYPIVKMGLENYEGTTFTKKEVMTILKEMFFYEEINGQRVQGSLAKASKQELIQFISKVIDFAHITFGVTIPEPQDLNHIYGNTSNL